MATRLILYCHYSTREQLPVYVQYALRKLSETGYSVRVLTNDRHLDGEARALLDRLGLPLHVFENRGYDFGMWLRHLRRLHVEELERLVLINDSVVYFQDKFREFFGRADRTEGQLVGLTSNDEVFPHVQSFFLYLKPPAIRFAFEYLDRVGILDDFDEVVVRQEIGLSHHLRACGLRTEALYPHTRYRRPILFSYRELIEEGGGFIKRKLLDKSFRPHEIAYIRQEGFTASLEFDYKAFIRTNGYLAPDFPPAGLDP